MKSAHTNSVNRINQIHIVNDVDSHLSLLSSNPKNAPKLFPLLQNPPFFPFPKSHSFSDIYRSSNPRNTILLYTLNHLVPQKNYYKIKRLFLALINQFLFLFFIFIFVFRFGDCRTSFIYFYFYYQSL